MTNPTPPARYCLILDVDVEGGLCEYWLSTYPRYGTTPLHNVHQEEISTFCFTWKDIADMVSRHWQIAGGPSEVILHGPSPYVDLS